MLKQRPLKKLGEMDMNELKSLIEYLKGLRIHIANMEKELKNQDDILATRIENAIAEINKRVKL